MKKILASASPRIDLAGGWADDCKAYSQDGKPIMGEVCNVAINLRSSITIIPSVGCGILVHSNGENRLLTGQYGGKFDLFEAAYNRYRVDLDKAKLRLDISAFSLVPFGSGLGGSAAIAVPLVAAIRRALKCDQDLKFLSEEYRDLIAAEARALEIEEMKKSSGWQDQGAAVSRGGINYFQAINDPSVPVRKQLIGPEDKRSQLLENHLLLVHTTREDEVRRSSDQIQKWVKKIGDEERIQILESIVEQAKAVKEAVLNGDMLGLGGVVSDTWEAILKLTSHTASSTEIDELIDRSMDAGAYGAKACGAGGPGSCVVIIADKKAQDEIKTKIRQNNGYKILPIKIDTQGLVLKEIS